MMIRAESRAVSMALAALFTACQAGLTTRTCKSCADPTTQAIGPTARVLAAPEADVRTSVFRPTGRRTCECWNCGSAAKAVVESGLSIDSLPSSKLSYGGSFFTPTVAVRISSMKQGYSCLASSRLRNSAASWN